MIATKADEVGHKITYVIYFKKSDRPVDEADVERVANSRERHPGSISVLVSPSSGFTRSAADLAERRGVRLWGPGEIERLRRNVAEKRSLRQREVIEKSDFREVGTKRRSKAKLIGLLIILSIALLYVKFYGFDTSSIQDSITALRDLIEESGLRDEELRENYHTRAQEIFQAIYDAANRIHDVITQNITQFCSSPNYLEKS
jgi:hypothetical protein